MLKPDLAKPFRIPLPGRNNSFGADSIITFPEKSRKHLAGLVKLPQRPRRDLGSQRKPASGKDLARFGQFLRM